MDEATNAKHRSESMRRMQQLGLSESESEIVFDLTIHTCMEAIATANRVANTAPPGLRVYVLALANQALYSIFHAEAERTTILMEAMVSRPDFPKHWEDKPNAKG